MDEQATVEGLYRKKPVAIAASQWFKNGDHPLDYSKPVEGLENGELRTWTGDEARALAWEGQVVRYYRHPGVPGDKPCEQCGKTHHVHGWIDTLEGGHIVCPGDWIITGVKGEHYPCKPDIFAQTYEPASSAPPAAAAGEGATQYVNGFLCKAWGETDLPEARLVRTREEWEAFVVTAQWGDDTTYADLGADEREMVDAQVKYIAQDMTDNGEGSINFEIGGVSVERVAFLAASPSAPSLQPVQQACPGRPDSRCDYLAACGQVCSKCGKVHNGCAALSVQAGTSTAPEVPTDAIGRVLLEVMERAVANGANSVSMPDDYVAIAAWLASLSASPSPQATKENEHAQD